MAALPYHYSFCCWMMVRRSRCSPLAFSTLHLSFSFVICSFLRYHVVYCSTSFPWLWCFCQYQQSMSKAHRHREKVIWLRNIAAMILLFHMGLSLVRAVVGWTIVNSTTGFDPLSEIIEPKYLNFVTLSNSSIWPWSLYNTCIINFHALELQDVMCININCYCCFLLSDFVI